MKKLYIISLALFLFSGCAQVVPPTGGPKDHTPPKVVEYSPANKSVLFHAKKIDITFNKYIQLKDLSKQFIVSPPLKVMPIPVVKGRVLEISFAKDTLRDSTTYTFNFGNAVCDLHEANPIKNFEYVFSTGTYVDSLSVHGIARDAFSHDPIKEGYVLLYSNLDDSTPYKKPPSYCAQTDDNGYYHIDNVKEGEYRLMAVSGGSGDYLYHPYSESMAFESNNLHLVKSDSVNLFLFTEVQSKLQFIKARAVGKGAILLVFNKPADSIKITPTNIDTSKPYNTLFQYSTTADSVTYWTSYPDLDSLRFIVSRNSKILDTTIVYNIPGHNVKTTGTSKKKNVKVEKAPSLPISLNVFEKTPYNYHLPFTIQFPQPVMSYDLSKISLTQRTDTIGLRQVSKPSPYSISLSPMKELISDSTYKLKILPGAFTDLFGYTNDTSVTHFKIEDPSFYGTLTLNLSFSKKTHYLVQLLTSKGAVYMQDTVSGNKSIFYDGLPPDIYSIRVIEDDNDNGKWDIGNYLKGIQPETIIYYPDQINVRSNWDINQPPWKVN